MAATAPEPGAQPSSGTDAADTAGVAERPSGVRRVVQILGAVLSAARGPPVRRRRSISEAMAVS